MAGRGLLRTIGGMPHLLRFARSARYLLVVALSLVAVGLLFPVACTPAAQAREQCAIDAARALPLDDPDQISVGDTRQFGRRIKACLAAPPSPGGAPDAGG